jgi:hypothetical protein
MFVPPIPIWMGMDQVPLMVLFIMTELLLYILFDLSN